MGMCGNTLGVNMLLRLSRLVEDGESHMLQQVSAPLRHLLCSYVHKDLML